MLRALITAISSSCIYGNSNKNPMVSTRIITLMFHRVFEPHLGYDPAQFERYLQYLLEHYPIVVPGDNLKRNAISICLTFDDAYYDFYYYVYPLLKKYNIKAILAVPVKYILDTTTLSAQTRLSVPYPQGMADNLFAQKAPFCTWEELREMADGKHVIMASHGFAHADLSHPNTD